MNDDPLMDDLLRKRWPRPPLVSSTFDTKVMAAVRPRRLRLSGTAS